MRVPTFVKILLVAGVAASAAVPPQTKALLDIYTKMGGKNFEGVAADWGVSTKGEAIVPPCDGSTSQWGDSIRCEAGNVVGLYLGNVDANDDPTAPANVIGKIPASFSGLKKLTSLDLSGNPGLTGIDNIKLATGLKELNIAGSNLGTKLRAHTFLATLTKLTYLGLLNNQLTGTIPPFLSALKSLVDLDLGYNQIGGDLSAVSKFTSLTGLWLNDNKIGGPIPADLTKITGLATFDASNNKLTGTVPAAVTTAFVVGTNIDVANICGNAGLVGAGTWTCT